jgi:hypothetical protein
MFCGICIDRVVSADLLAGGHNQVMDLVGQTILFRRLP